MDDNVKFLAEMAAFYNTTATPEQEKFVRGIERGGNPLLIEADGGIGKTFGYLIHGLRQAQTKNLPLIIATSTITNRDQIETEYEKIIKYAKHIGDPIATIPLLNYRSARDYVSPARLARIISRLEKAKAAKHVLDELYDIQARACDPDALLERVMPYDIAAVKDGKVKVLVSRGEIAARSSSEIAKSDDDEQPTAFAEIRKIIKEYTSGTAEACAIMMTHAMLAGSTQFRKMIAKGDAAMVVIDEVDKLTSMDFITYTSITIADIESILARAENFDIDTHAVSEIVDQLQTLTADIKTVVTDNNTILIYDRIGEARTKTARASISNLADTLDELAGQIAKIPVTPDTEIAARLLLLDTDELRDAADRLCDAMNPQNWTMNTTDTRVFLSWGKEVEFRVVSARPGSVMEWLYRAPVPALLTTAFLGEEEKWFARKIKLPIHRLKTVNAIRSHRFGVLKFTYFRGLHDAIYDEKPNPAHYDDIVQAIRHYWEPGERVVVLMPGYDDIEQVQRRLIGANPPIFAHLPTTPLFPHLQGTNINEIRDKLIRSDEGGILLTVYWEGFNIVGNRPDRRGMIDVLVMSRIPFQPPNPMLHTLHTHFGWSDGIVYRDLKTEAKRRIHQGFNRVIRGPMDKGRVLILDSRFPAPPALTNIHDDIPRLARYVSLLDAIPERFRDNEKFFEYVDFNTMTMITDD